MKLEYRPEIDGLRAIAVGAVILYHAQITIFGHQPFRGGFIGVDIFFVISGYLITSIILKELVTTGSFSFQSFYERRIRRILPALLFVMLMSLPFAWMYFLTDQLVDFSKSILYSLGFSSNFYFHFSGQEYGEWRGFLKPFLHTWSLSVEEQYYILFPIVLLVTFKYFKKYLIHILIFGFVISLGLAEWTSRNYPSSSFYFLHTRMWELLAGSILAYFEIILGRRSKIQRLNLILPFIGIVLIGHSIIFFNNEIYHPSLYTLSPIIGVCLIIWFSDKNELITKILSTKLFVGIGLISYSLYLWHYPIFAFARATYFFQNDIVKELSSGLVIIILSIISYYFIEKPFRNKNYNFKFLVNIILFIFFVLIIVNFKIIFNDGYKNRLPEILRNYGNNKSWDLLKNSEGKICHHYIDGCKFNTTSNKKVYIIGDSLMGTLLFDLKKKIVKNQYQFITSTYGGCIYVPGFNKVSVKTKIIDKKCNDIYFKKLKNKLLEEKKSIIIFGGRLPLYISNTKFDNQEGGDEGSFEHGPKWPDKYFSLGKYETFQESFKEEILELSKKHSVILIYPIPEVGWDPNREIYLRLLNKNYRIKDNLSSLENVTTSFEVYKERTKLSFDLLDKIQNDNIYRVYPHTLFCNIIIEGRCVTHDSKNVFYTDNHHPSLKGSEMINDLIMKEIEKIKTNSN